MDPHLELLEAARAGEGPALRTFLVTTGPAMLNIVRRMLGRGHPDEDDLLQECALAVVRALPSFRGECTVLHFVCRICVLTTLRIRRRSTTRKRDVNVDTECEPESIPSQEGSAEEALSARTAALVLRELLQSLPSAQAEALALHCALGYTLAELEDATGVCRETLRSRLRLGKQALRNRLRQHAVALELLGEEVS